MKLPSNTDEMTIPFQPNVEQRLKKILILCEKSGLQTAQIVMLKDGETWRKFLEINVFTPFSMRTSAL